MSGPKTQLINIVTNSYMVAARPVERMLGASLPANDPQSGRVFREAVRQYTYLGTAFTEGFSLAKKAFLQNDSVLAPHRTEAYRGNQAVAFKPWESPGAILHNALVVAATGIGLPTRALGFVGEAVKQTVYRSKVMSAAHMDGVEQGIAAGLSDDALDAFVKPHVTSKLDASFDELGPGTDAVALREAQIATFQQELLPGQRWQVAPGRHTAVLSAAPDPPLREDPHHVIRYGWEMTPA